jgi:hypothetical protein
LWASATAACSSKCARQPALANATMAWVQCSAAARRACGWSGTSHRNHRFLPNAFSSFPAAWVRGRMSFLYQETIFFIFRSLSSFIDLTCHLFLLGGTLFNVDRNYPIWSSLYNSCYSIPAIHGGPHASASLVFFSSTSLPPTHILFPPLNLPRPLSHHPPPILFLQW